MKKDREALNRITWGGAYMIGGIGYDKRTDNDPIPVKRLRCNKSSKCFANKHNQNLYAVDKVFLRNRGKGIICRCSVCGTFEVFPVSSFEERKSAPFHPFNYYFSAESLERRRMEMNGIDKEDIDAKCEFMKEEFAKQDAKRKMEEKNFRATIHAGAKEHAAKEEQKRFKERLDAGEIKFDKVARAFYEVATGRVVRKL